MTIAAHDPQATLDIYGDVAPFYGRYDLVRQRDPQSLEGEWRKPLYGPGYEQSAGMQGHPALHELTYGLRDEGAWCEDYYTGVHAFIGESIVDDAHIGYQEPWGVELPNDRNVRVGQEVVPWDYGLSAVGVYADVRI